MSGHTLVFRLAAPLQSWGVSSRFGIRDTLRFPSKSGVLGLVCAACGIDRNDDRALAALVVLPFSVRIDRPGVLLEDFQTAQKIAKAGGGLKDTDVSRRHYLSDAVFQAALESESIESLERILCGLQNPHWPLSLGRRACPPDPLDPRIIETTRARDALGSVPWRQRDDREEIPQTLPCIIECGPGEGMTVNDAPISFRVGHRRFLPRHVRRVELAGFPVLDRGGEPLIQEEGVPCCSTG